MNKLLLFLIINVFAIELHSQISDEEIISAIAHDKTEIVKNYFKSQNDPNRLYGNEKISLLHFSISISKIDAAEILLDAGADIDLLFEDETPLMTAVKYSKENSLSFLIQKGANINKQNKKGQTAAIKAAKYDNKELLKLLIANNVNLDIKDKSGKTALDYAYFLQNINAYNYLCTVKECKYDKVPLPNYFDGPYVSNINDSKIKVSYFYHDSIENKTFETDSIIDIKDKTIVLNKAGQYFDIPIESNPKCNKTKDKYSNVKKIMAVGDLHGGFIEFKNFLIANNIIDTNYNWTFDDGHLMLVGDIFDRGDKVTECFWLIYKLEKEAKDKGGMVHLLLGNHEIMELSGDKRYLNPKYLALYNNLRLNYTDLYRKNTKIGDWLRCKNAIIQINNLLFVHGGISIQIVNKKLNIASINSSIHDMINRDAIVEKNKDDELIFGENGPIWYRGYLKPEDNYYKDFAGKYDFNEETLDKILKFYKVSNIVFGHTNVNEIKPLFNNKIFGIDIPFEEPGVFLQGLYYENGNFYKALNDGTHISFK